MLARFYQTILGNVQATFLTDVFHTYKFSDYAIISYNYTHSIFVWLLVTLLIWAVIKKFPWVLLAWGLHITIDVFSHTFDFFSTPFLFPFSNFEISIIAWSHPVFMLINYSLLLILYLVVLPKFKKKKTDETEAPSA